MRSALCSWPAFWRRQPSRAFADDDEGFVRLFNGRNLNGWDVHASVKSYWAVEDGLIVCRQRAYSPYYLRTKSAYANFELRLEYKLPRAASCSVNFWLPIEYPSKRGWVIGMATTPIL